MTAMVGGPRRLGYIRAMNGPRIFALGAVVALGLTTVAAASSASIQVTPRQGTARTDFVVRFKAQQATGGTTSRYDVHASGPSGRRCASSITVSLAPPRTGQTLSVTLKPPGRSHVWCRGSYAGTVNDMVRPRCSGPELCPQYIALITVGGFKFRVG